MRDITRNRNGNPQTFSVISFSDGYSTSLDSRFCMILCMMGKMFPSPSPSSTPRPSMALFSSSSDMPEFYTGQGKGKQVHYHLGKLTTLSGIKEVSKHAYNKMMRQGLRKISKSTCLLRLLVKCPRVGYLCFLIPSPLPEDPWHFWLVHLMSLLSK